MTFRKVDHGENSLLIGYELCSVPRGGGLCFLELRSLYWMNTKMMLVLWEISVVAILCHDFSEFETQDSQCAHLEKS